MTERKRAREALQASEERLRTVITSSLHCAVGDRHKRRVLFSEGQGLATVRVKVRARPLPWISRFALSPKRLNNLINFIWSSAQ